MERGAWGKNTSSTSRRKRKKRKGAIQTRRLTPPHLYGITSYIRHVWFEVALCTRRVGRSSIYVLTIASFSGRCTSAPPFQSPRALFTGNPRPLPTSSASSVSHAPHVLPLWRFLLFHQGRATRRLTRASKFFLVLALAAGAGYSRERSQVRATEPLSLDSFQEVLHTVHCTSASASVSISVSYRQRNIDDSNGTSVRCRPPPLSAIPLSCVHRHRQRLLDAYAQC